MLTLTITFNPAVLRVRTVAGRHFMRPGGVDRGLHASRSIRRRPRRHHHLRTGDATGASGTGLLAALLFDAVAPGTGDT